MCVKRKEHLRFTVKLIVLLQFVILQRDVCATDVIVTAEKSTIEVTLTGFTRAKAFLPLASEASGKVKDVYVNIGDTIPDDGKIACLDTTFINLNLLENEVEQKRLETDIEYLSKQVFRYRKLHKKSSISRSQLDDKERQLQVSKQKLNVLVLQGEVLKERMKRYCIIAQPGLQIVEREIEPGQWVSQGESIGMVGDYTSVLVPYALSFQEYQAIKGLENNLTIYLTDLNVSVPASIENVSPAFDKTTMKIRVNIIIRQGVQKLRGGLRAQLKLSVQQPGSPVLLPSTAVQERYEEYWVTRNDGSEKRVNYLGRSGQRDSTGKPLLVIHDPDIKPGDEFLSYKN